VKRVKRSEHTRSRTVKTEKYESRSEKKNLQAGTDDTVRLAAERRGKFRPGTTADLKEGCVRVGVRIALCPCETFEDGQTHTR